MMDCVLKSEKEMKHVQQDTSKPAKGKRGTKKGKRGREPTIVFVFFHRWRKFSKIK
jgi:hypothetical protein